MKVLVMAEFKRIFQGKLSKKNLLYYYLPFMIGFFLICLLIARILYPYIPLNPYIWTTSMISRLGWPEENPIGFIFFSIGFIVEGMMFFPISLYIHGKYSDMNEFVAKLIRFLLIAYSMATLLIGAIPNFSEPPIFSTIHGINAIVIFGGFGLLSLISAITMLKERINFSRNLLTIYIAFLIYYLVCITSIVVFFQTSVPGRSVLGSSTPFYSSPPFYEWQAYMITFCLLTIQCLLLPEKMS